MAQGRSESSEQLRRIAGACALPFLLCLIVLVLLDAGGLAGRWAASLIPAIAVVLYCAAGLAASTANPVEFQIAGRRISAAFAGMAASAQWSAPVLLLASPTSLFAAGYEGRPMLIGLTGGYVLLAVLIAPFVRNSGAQTLPAFINARFGTVAGLLAVMMLLICSLLFMAALLQTGLGFIARIVAAPIATALVIGTLVLLICAVSGGMKSVIASQVAQYTLILVAALALFLLLAANRSDTPTGAPYDPVMEALNILTQGLGLAPAPSPRGVEFHGGATISHLEFIICLMAGTASLPHIMMHPLATCGMNEARRWAAWSLLFITVLIFALPSSIRLATAPTSDLSGPMAGLVAAIAAIATAAAASGLLFTIAGSLAQGFRLRQSVGQDSAPAALLPRAPVLIARILMIVVAVGIAYVVATQPLEAASMLAWSFSLAAAGLFPALVLGIWWERVTTAGAVIGMLAGFSISLFYIVATRYFPQAAIADFGMSALADPVSAKPLVDVARILANPRWQTDVPASLANPLMSKVGWFNVGNEACGIFGLAVGFAVIIIVSLLGRIPGAEARGYVESIRAPGARGRG